MLVTPIALSLFSLSLSSQNPRRRSVTASAMANAAFLLRFSAAVALLVLTARAQTDSGDAAAMRALAKSIGADSALGWSSTSDPCSKWGKIQCESGKVTAIQIGYSNLSGTVPPEVANLTSLQRLELMFNAFSGPLPSLKNLRSLSVLLLHNNNFTSIPSDFFTGLSALTVVTLDHNPFDPWPIPPSLKDCSVLQNFSANGASVVGGVPDFLATSFPFIDHVALSRNNLGGEIPRSFAGSDIKSLWLQFANLGGGVDVIANMTNLIEVFLQSNSLTGPLPDFSGMTSLQFLNLRDNQITGPVPASLTGLKSLQSVTLTNNLLQGPVPSFSNGVQLDLDPNSESFCLNVTGDCDQRVDILLSIASSVGYPLQFARNWKGNNPCVNWPGILCDPNGSITGVNFARMNLSGFISPDFEKLASLQKLDLSHNNLTGTIPPGLADLKHLNYLDLSNNSLWGEVPSFNNVIVNTDGNPNIGKNGTTPPPGSSPDGGGSASDGSGDGGSGRNSNVGVIVGSIIAVIVVGGIICWICFCYFKKKDSKFGKIQIPGTVIHPHHSGSDTELLKISAGLGGSESTSNSESGQMNIQVVEPVNLVISIHVLRAVTNDFSEENILGRGGFGTVYKGQLHDGTMIAVKRMEPGAIGSKGLNEFKSEISVLTRVRHRHLVSLLGYCLEASERILVYEYMPQGTLSHHLFDWAKAGLRPLEWKMRLSIALDVARGVEYLHSLMNQSFIHRDLKPSNILLGDDMRAKVADFGLVRHAPEGKLVSVETRIAGTFGYLAPEYAVTGRVTTKADVFSFGVILMELITGRKALDDSRPEDSTHLVTWFRRMQLNNDFIKAVDPAIDLSDDEISESVHIVAELAGHCSIRDPHQRPEMSYVVSKLSSLVEKWIPNSQNLDDVYGIDPDMTLSQALAAWQDIGNSQTGNGYSVQYGNSISNTASLNNTLDSIPPNPGGLQSQQAR